MEAPSSRDELVADEALWTAYVAEVGCTQV